MAGVSALQASAPTDFGQIWAAARAWTQGIDPYAVVGPGKAFEWGFPLFYPMPAILVGVPFSLIPLRLATAAFMGLGMVLFAWAVTRDRADDPRLMMCVSCAGVIAIQTGQWSPLLSAAALIPPIGPLLACKPTLGMALVAAWPSWRTVVGMAAFTLVSLVAWPSWPWQWLEAIQYQEHIIAPIMRPGGFLTLLALARWRLPEARLLVAWSCIPHSSGLYEAVPLFLLVRTWPEAIGLTLLTYLTKFLVYNVGAPYADFTAFQEASGNWMLWLIHLPCTALILSRRPSKHA